MIFVGATSVFAPDFKPYKGVSSNLNLFKQHILHQENFKPYKGVSSNVRNDKNIDCRKKVSNPIREYLQIERITKWNGAKRVSNPIREYLQMIEKLETELTKECFKPYKGVSSN